MTDLTNLKKTYEILDTFCNSTLIFGKNISPLSLKYPFKTTKELKSDLTLLKFPQAPGIIGPDISNLLGFYRIQLDLSSDLLFAITNRNNEIFITIGWIKTSIGKERILDSIYVLGSDSFYKAMHHIMEHISQIESPSNSNDLYEILYSIFSKYNHLIPITLERAVFDIQHEFPATMQELSVQSLRREAAEEKSKALVEEVNAKVAAYRIMLEDKSGLNQAKEDFKLQSDVQFRLQHSFLKRVTKLYNESISLRYSFCHRYLNEAILNKIYNRKA